MGSHSFDSLDAQSISIKFNCEKCGQLIEEELEWTRPDLGAEKYRDATGYEESDIHCPNCDDTYTVAVTAELAGGEIELFTDDEDHPFEVIETFREGYWDYFEDLDRSILEGENEDHLFDELNDVRLLLDLEIEDHLFNLLLKQSYTHVVSIMEAFLFELAYKMILNNPSMQEEFVKNHEPFQTKKISMANLHFEMRTIITKIKDELQNISFHNLQVVSKLFGTVLNINLGDLSELTPIIRIRHDLVHRNGKDKEGNPIELSKESVIEVIQKIEKFIKTVHTTKSIK